MRKTLFLFIFTIGASLMFTGCATTPPPPLQRAENFHPESMDTVYVMPVVDARIDKKLKCNLVGLQHSAAGNLKSKRYVVIEVKDTNTVANVTGEDLKDPAPDWIKGLGPTEARWLMFVEVDDLSRKITFGSSGQAEVVLVVLDKQTGTVVWRDKELGRAGQGGLVGMMLVSLMDDEALAAAFGQVLYKIPKKPKT